MRLFATFIILGFLVFLVPYIISITIGPEDVDAIMATPEYKAELARRTL